VPLVQLRAEVTALEVSLIYLADFLPGFFSRTNSLCLEDFLCYRKLLRTYGKKLVSLFLKLTNFGEFSLRQSLALFFLPGSARKLAHLHFEKEIII